MQNDRLFQESIHAFKDQKVREAIARVEGLSEAELLDPGLAGKLDGIVEQFRFVVATMRPQERKGKRRTETRQVRDYGELRNVEVSMIDVTIPFDGYPKSFTIAPSHCHVIDTPARTSQAGLQATFYDDDNLDRNVDSFISRVGENLERLRGEMESLRTQISDAVKAIADQRLAKVKAQKERDKSRSFPIE